MPTQLPRVPSLIPSSFATLAIGRDVSITIFTASSLNSGEKLFFGRGNYFTFPDIHPIGWTVRKLRGTSAAAGGRCGDGDGDGGDLLGEGGAGVAGAAGVAGGGALDLAGAVAGAAGVQQAGQDGAADDAGVRGGGADALGGGELVDGGLLGGGEAGPVRVGARGGGGVGHGHAQQLAEGQQGVAQGVVGGLDLPPLVVEPDQAGGGEAAVIQQGGDQPEAVLAAAAVRAGHGHVRLDDPHVQAADPGQVRPVRQDLEQLR